MSQVRLSITEGTDSERESLWDWLRAEPEFRGKLTQDLRATPGEMGGVSGVLITLAGLPSATVLARSLQVWLTQRHSDVRIEVSDVNGSRTVKLDAKRLRDIDETLKQIALIAGGSDADRPSSN